MASAGHCCRRSLSRVEQSWLLSLITRYLDPEGEEFALPSQRQEMIPRLRGRSVGCQPAPAFRETLILGLRHPRRAVHASLALIDYRSLFVP